MKKQKTNLEKILYLPLVKEASCLKLSSGVKEKLGERLFKIAKKNSRSINIYRIIYQSQGHKVVGFIVEPKKGDKLPCIIWNRGGSRDFGKITQEQLFLRLAEFAKNGYLVIASQYSGNDGGEGRDEFGGEDIHDVLNLYKILKSYKRADVNKTGMFGWSRGGMMTYQCLAKVKWIKAAVVGGAKSDEISAPKFRKGWREHQIKMYGGSKKEQLRRSALYWTDKFSKKIPILIMHGSSDWRVNPLDSIKIAENLQANKVPYRLVIFEGADHGITEHRREVNELTIKWFDRFLKNNEKINLKPHGF